MQHEGHSQTKIAQIIGVHKSTISRELSRNVPPRGRYANEYRPEAAQRKANQRHGNKRKHCRFTEDLKEDAIRWLTTEKLSPELISGRWKVQGIDGVSHKAIYQWIWHGKASVEAPSNIDDMLVTLARSGKSAAL